MSYTLSKENNMIIMEDSSGNLWGVEDSDTTYSNATTTASGLESAEDKAKLEGLGTLIGEANGNSYSAVSVPTGAWTQLLSISLPAGVWLLKISARFAENTTGVRRLSFGTDSAADGDVVWRNAEGNASETNYTYLHLITFAAPNSTTTYYINAYQNSGKSLSVTPRFGGYRIG